MKDISIRPNCSGRRRPGLCEACSDVVDTLELYLGERQRHERRFYFAFVRWVFGALDRSGCDRSLSLAYEWNTLICRRTLPPFHFHETELQKAIITQDLQGTNVVFCISQRFARLRLEACFSSTQDWTIELLMVLAKTIELPQHHVLVPLRIRLT